MPPCGPTTAAKTLRIERAVTDTGRIKQTKTGESREVNLSPRLVAALNDLAPSWKRTRWRTAATT